MKIFNQNIDFKKILIVLVVTIGAASLQLYILTLFRMHGDADFNEFSDLIATYIFFIVSILLTLFVWRLLSFLGDKVMLRSILTFLISFVCFILLETFVDWVGYQQSFPYVFWDRVLNAFAIAVMYHIQVSGITIGYLHLTESQKVKTDLEMAQKEKENLQLRVLRKNLEPHFLFNNLNVLSGLAKKDSEKIDDFIDDFSEVYRYYLKNDKKEVVSLEEEIIFLEKYMELVKRRLGNAYQLQINMNSKEGFVIPCVLQLCVENAIKHNKGSEAIPLKINISRIDDTIIISNQLNKVDFTIGTQTGNRYLKDQYRILFDKIVVIEESDQQFIVKIPIV